MAQGVPLSDAVRAKFARALFWTPVTLNAIPKAAHR
jgi:hypothetical protein